MTSTLQHPDQSYMQSVDEIKAGGQTININGRSLIVFQLRLSRGTASSFPSYLVSLANNVLTMGDGTVLCHVLRYNGTRSRGKACLLFMFPIIGFSCQIYCSLCALKSTKFWKQIHFTNHDFGTETV